MITAPQHYQNDADGLCTRLRISVPKHGLLQLDTTAFEKAGWVIPVSDLDFGPIKETLGKGEFGDVHLAYYKKQKVAVKVLKESRAAHYFLAEASVMTTLRHKNLVQLMGLVFDNNSIFLVTVRRYFSLIPSQ